jgi:hypothetical protein
MTHAQYVAQIQALHAGRIEVVGGEPKPETTP